MSGCRNTARNKPTTQVQLCATGGAVTDSGWKAVQSGVGLFLSDPFTTHKIGQTWRSGKNPGDYGQTLTFQAQLKKGPVSIGGSISQQGGDFLDGSFKGPYSSLVDTYQRNAVNAWWQDGCVTGWTRCKAPTDGQDYFRAAVAQGLWEFTRAKAKTRPPLYVTAFLKSTCKRAGGCG